VNADGHLDLVVTTFDGVSISASLSVLLGDGAGSFGAPSPAQPIGSGIAAGSPTLADVDQDGDLDVVLLSVADDRTFDGALHVIKGDGSGAFGPPAALVVGDQPVDLALADFNHDGRLDVAVATVGDPEGTTGGVEIRFGDGAGAFGALVSFVAAPGASRVAAADFDEDGDLDLGVTASYPTGSVTVAHGDGTGHFGAPVVYPLFEAALDLKAADMTGDGHLDLVVSGAAFRNQQIHSLVGILAGDGAGGFGPAKSFFLPSGVTLAVADLDADGRLDVAATGNGPQGGPNATVMLGLCGNVADVAISVTDAPGAVVIGKEATYTLEVVSNGPDLADAAAGLHLPRGLAWTGGDAQAGYVVGRLIGGVHTQFPAAGMLAPDTTSYVDSTAVAGQINCYQVVPMTAEGEALGSSDVLCAVPGHSSPPGALGDLRLTDFVDLTWSPFGGQTSYLLSLNSGGPGTFDILLPPEATSAHYPIGRPT